MASSDYRLCDVCDGKAFYDSNLNYEFGRPQYSVGPFKNCGEAQNSISLERLGDWAVLCHECAKTHKCQIVKIEDKNKAG